MFISDHITKLIATERSQGLRDEAGTVRRRVRSSRRSRRLLKPNPGRRPAMTPAKTEER
jgi:hypothetical protein